MRKISILLLIIWGCAITFSGMLFGWKIPFATHIALYDELRDVAGTVFTIAGVWLGVLYPSEFQKVFQKGMSIEDGISNNIVSLVRVLSISAINLLIVLFLSFIANTLKSLSLDIFSVKNLKIGSFVMLAILFSTQVWTLLILLRHTLGFDVGMSLKQLYQKRIASRFKK